MIPDSLLKWLPIAAFTLGLVLAVPRLPQPLGPEEADAQGEFSALRAQEWVARIATAPRPSGSARHAEVLDLLEGELGSLGFEVERQGSPLQNLVARAPGAGLGGLWLVAHSDSVRAGPGAADDGLGLAVALEAARVLGGRRRLPEVNVLFTDAEEQGLLGARAFVAEYPEPRVVLNLEARGTEGPVFMFQSAGPVLEKWQKSRCTAQSTSLARAVYDLLPNDTDFTIFRAAGAVGYDFALIHGAENYHTPKDSPDRLDPRSIQQLGDCVVRLGRVWGEAEAVRTESTAGMDSVWFQLFGRTLVFHPWVIQVLITTMFVIIARPFRRGVWYWLGALPLCFGIGLGGQFLLARQPVFYEGVAEMPGAEPIYLGAWALGLAMTALLARGTRRTGWLFGQISFATVMVAAWPQVAYVLIPGAWAAVAEYRGWRWAQVGASFLAGLILGPLVLALGPALTTRMLPVLCVAPILLLGWLGPLASREPKQF
jgi:Peptidase family M28